MSEFPEISVVMGVYDGAAHLAETIDSVLSQRGVKFELVVVDDGSSDATPAILECYASRDARVRVRRQGRLGLTRALIAGCAAARAPVIARQDCGDVSLPGRLARQLDRLRSTPGTSLVSVGAEFIGPRGEWLYAVQDTDATFMAGLARTSMATTRGPSHHGATMFSRATYEAVGGYRGAFAVAQDLDLWMRLWERGGVLAVPEVLYRARLHPRSLSATRRPEQVAYTRVIIEGASARRDGRRDDSVEAAERLISSRRRGKMEATAASYSYFLARVLEAGQPEMAKQYLTEALRENPLLARAWFAWARLSARGWRPRWRRQVAP
jgi:glycosyltransferase involved in cell wall biosynthesis